MLGIGGGGGGGPLSFGGGGGGGGGGADDERAEDLADDWPDRTSRRASGGSIPALFQVTPVG